MIWRGQADGQTVEADDGRGEGMDAGEASPRADLGGGAGG